VPPLSASDARADINAGRTTGFAACGADCSARAQGEADVRDEPVTSLNLKLRAGCSLHWAAMPAMRFWR